ncbi:DUF1361 domain-containing protein [Synechococcales cyanobacterium C]|uniref:DUF1361 domain-containing protein n=1 Tax=Petrachloros mirabilis ULC683 TaxID=2781853 RepID=A0A8K2A783_9CYAN|nr:DUF1361 domain-containing protein [Petrachloros mirabilis]NCJ05815.1 DUF1361 domain-containing protein [Petrachloros mirabilis ULC683]
MSYAQLGEALVALNRHGGWMVWNLFLAFIPFALSFWLFRWPSRTRGSLQAPKLSVVWWLGLVIFILFLPNAPYLLTDIIHLIKAIQTGYSIWTIILVLIPVHSLVILVGFEAYVISLINQGIFLSQFGGSRLISIGELAVHALCAIGIFLGRFYRFNSWDLIADPTNLILSTLNALTARQPLVVMALTFVVLTLFYWIMKQLTLGLVLQFQAAQRRARQPMISK